MNPNFFFMAVIISLVFFSFGIFVLYRYFSDYLKNLEKKMFQIEDLKNYIYKFGDSDCETDDLEITEIKKKPSIFSGTRLRE